MPNQSVSQKLNERLVQIIASALPGDRLPSEPHLAKQLGVSRATLREAMRTFESQGLLRRRQGSGTFVTHPSTVIDSGLEILESIETLAQRKNLPVRMGTLKVEQRPASAEECQALEISASCEVIQVSRVIETEDRPVAFLIDILPVDVMTLDDIAAGFSGSVLDFLLERGSPALAVSRTNITAVTANSEISRALGIQRGDVLLHFFASLYSNEGRVVDNSYSYFLPGYFNFHVVRRVS
ncbi:MAG: GntR family transcriptional regulator [Anaerolineales bacterium]|jgi:GntR family transcriptional regulator|nr:GntR family transcriptional regulator [Anaerolineales bacterium]